MNLPRGHKHHTCACNACRKWQRENLKSIPTKEPKMAVTSHLVDASDPDALRNLVINSTHRSDRKSAVAQLYLRQLEDPTVTLKEVAHELGLSSTTLQSYKSLATTEGWFRHSDPVKRLENEGLKKATDTVITHIEQGNLDAALALLRGFGIFRNHSSSKASADTETPRLEINIDLDASSIQPSTKIVSSPRIIDVEASD